MKGEQRSAMGPEDRSQQIESVPSSQVDVPMEQDSGTPDVGKAAMEVKEEELITEAKEPSQTPSEAPQVAR